MHRHGYKGRKFGRETDQRRALMRGLMRALVESREIETTEAKAKELRRVMEKVITLARKGGLHGRRLVLSKLNDQKATGVLIEEIVPRLKRDSGYLRIERTRLRVGDNAQMARIGFVDDVGGSGVGVAEVGAGEKVAGGASGKADGDGGKVAAPAKKADAKEAKVVAPAGEKEKK